MRKGVICLLSLLMAGCLGGCEQEKEAPRLLEPVGLKLDTAVAQMGEIYQIGAYSGEVVPYVEEVGFIMDGHLGEIRVSLGETVKEGQVLATLDTEAMLESIQALEAEIRDTIIMGQFSDRTAAANVEIAEAELWILKDSGAASEKCEAKEIEVEMLEVKLRQAQELRELELARLNEQLKEQKEELSNTEIKAPISGEVVYISLVKEGDWINGYTPVICIADNERLSISAEYISAQNIVRADKISARIMDQEYDVTYVPYDDGEYISMVLSGEEMRTQFSVDQGAEQLEAGQYAAITVISSYKDNVLTIPANALYRDEKGHYVYKIVDGERVRCNVTVGLVTDVEAEITEGLQEGDVVYVKE